MVQLETSTASTYRVGTWSVPVSPFSVYAMTTSDRDRRVVRLDPGLANQTVGFVLSSLVSMPFLPEHEPPVTEVALFIVLMKRLNYPDFFRFKFRVPIFNATVQAQQDVFPPPCPSCSGRLQLLDMHLSGSRVPGIHIEESDEDYMCEFGPVEWVKGRTAGEPATSPGSLRLRLTPTGNAGFYLLKQEPRAGCRHVEPLLFTAEYPRRIIQQVTRIHGAQSNATIIADHGPAASYRYSYIHPSEDYVPCVRLGFWPEKDAFERLHNLNMPPNVVRKIQDFGVNLVPVGLPGSPTEEQEWRVSFSQAETLILLYMAPILKHAIIILKACKQHMGPEGEALKSYYIITTAMWLWHDMPQSYWINLHHAAISVLEHLETCLESRKLPCFLMSSINVLKSTPEEEWVKITNAVKKIKAQFSRLPWEYIHKSVPKLLLDKIVYAGGRNSPCQENSLCTHLARVILVLGIDDCLFYAYRDCALKARILLWTGPITLLGRRYVKHIEYRISWRYNMHLVLLKALTVAPEHVVRRVQMTPAGDDSWTWDAAPLMELLTAEDFNRVFGRRAEAVFKACGMESAWPAEGGPSAVTPRALAGIVADMPRLLRHLPQFRPEASQWWDKTALMLSEEARNAWNDCFKVTRIGADKNRPTDMDSSDFRELVERHDVYVRHRRPNSEEEEDRERLRLCLQDSWGLKPHLERRLRR